MRIRNFLAASAAVGLAVANTVAAAASDCKPVQVAELPVRLAHNKLVVDGAINGRKIGVMLDTGAMRTLIFRSAAVRLSLRRDRVGGYRAFGVGGETDLESAFVGEFKIGQAARKGWRIMVAGEHDPGDDVAVLLGEDFFHQVDVEFDLAHDAVRLFQPQPKDCNRVSLAYWATDGVGAVEIEPVYNASPQIILTVQINGKPIRALLDSGASMSVLDKPEAARLGVTPETSGVIVAGSGTGLGKKSVEHWIGPFQSFAVGNEMVEGTMIGFADLWKDATYIPTGSNVPRQVGGRPAMLLGADFLRAHRLLVAHSQRKIYFTYAGGTVFQETRALKGGSDPRAFKGTGASCEYSSECSGDLGCTNGQCQ